MVRLAKGHDVRLIELTLGIHSNLDRADTSRRVGFLLGSRHGDWDIVSACRVGGRKGYRSLRRFVGTGLPEMHLCHVCHSDYKPYVPTQKTEQRAVP